MTMQRIYEDEGTVSQAEVSSAKAIMMAKLTGNIRGKQYSRTRDALLRRQYP